MFTIMGRNRSRCHRGDHTCQLMVEVSKLFSFWGKIHEALRGREGWWAYGEGCVVGVMWEGWDLAHMQKKERSIYKGPP